MLGKISTVIFLFMGHASNGASCWSVCHVADIICLQTLEGLLIFCADIHVTPRISPNDFCIAVPPAGPGFHLSGLNN